MKKISELNADKYFDLLEFVYPIIPNILEIDMIKKFLLASKEINKIEDNQNLEEKIEDRFIGLGISGAIEVAKLLTSNYRSEIFNILAILNDTTSEALKENMKANEITSQIISIIKDEDFRSFFTSLAKSD